MNVYMDLRKNVVPYDNRTTWIDCNLCTKEDPYNNKIFHSLEESVKDNDIFNRFEALGGTAATIEFSQMCELAYATVQEDRAKAQIGLHRDINCHDMMRYIAYNLDIAKATFGEHKHIHQNFGKMIVLLRLIDGDRGWSLPGVNDYVARTLVSVDEFVKRTDITRIPMFPEEVRDMVRSLRVNCPDWGLMSELFFIGDTEPDEWMMNAEMVYVCSILEMKSPQAGFETYIGGKLERSQWLALMEAYMTAFKPKEGQR